MKLFRRELFRSEDSAFRIFSKMSEFDITYTRFRSSDGVEFEMYNIPDRVKLAISIAGKSFNIGWQRHMHALNGFSKAFEWFYEKKKKDLFYKDEAGDLFYNSEYNNLVETIYSGQKDHSFIEIRPVVVERGMSKYEGVIIALDDKESYAMLTVSELMQVVAIMSQFSFQAEANILMNAMQSTGKIRVVDQNYKSDAFKNNSPHGNRPAVDWSKK